MKPKNFTPHKLARLSDGTHRVASSLYLQVRGGSRLWTFRYSLAGKARWLSLGSLDLVTKDEAVAAAAAARVRVRLHGVDLVPERRAQREQDHAALAEARKAEPVTAKKSGHTFGEAIDAAALAESVNWKPHKDAIAKWISPIKRYCTALVSKDVTQISEQHVVDCLAPHWLTNHQTALRTLGRVVTIMGYARREGWIAGENPVNAERAKEKLPKAPAKKAKHHPAMALGKLPKFARDLQAIATPMAAFFEFLILAGTRCNEAAGARWCEVDLANALWTIPGGDLTSRLKRWQHGDHRVPLTPRMVEILEARRAVLDASDANALVFADRDGEPFTADQLSAMLRDMGHAKGTASVHGFRSCLRVFLSRHCTGDHVAKELCLHHEVRTETQLAYDRDDRLHERRGMLAAWDAYCAGRVSLATETAVILPLRHAIAA